MNAKLIAFLAAASMSLAAVAQTQTSGTSNTNTSGTPTQNQSTANSGEQNATTMQNNSNAPANAQPTTAKDMKMAKKGKDRKTDCNTAHTDGNATAPAHAPCEDTNVRAKR